MTQRRDAALAHLEATFRAYALGMLLAVGLMGAPVSAAIALVQAKVGTAANIRYTVACLARHGGGDQKALRRVDGHARKSTRCTNLRVAADRITHRLLYEDLCLTM